MYLLILAAVITLLFILYLPYSQKKIDHYDTTYPSDFAPYQSTNLYSGYMEPDAYPPIWSSPLRSTRGMSYDLRGDVPIPYYMNLPFNMSTRIPIRNKPLYMVS